MIDHPSTTLPLPVSERDIRRSIIHPNSYVPKIAEVQNELDKLIQGKKAEITGLELERAAVIRARESVRTYANNPEHLPAFLCHYFQFHGYSGFIEAVLKQSELPAAKAALRFAEIERTFPSSPSLEPQCIRNNEALQEAAELLRSHGLLLEQLRPHACGSFFRASVFRLLQNPIVTAQQAQHFNLYSRNPREVDYRIRHERTIRSTLPFTVGDFVSPEPPDSPWRYIFEFAQNPKTEPILRSSCVLRLTELSTNGVFIRQEAEMCAVHLLREVNVPGQLKYRATEYLFHSAQSSRLSEHALTRLRRFRDTSEKTLRKQIFPQMPLWRSLKEWRTAAYKRNAFDQNEAMWHLKLAASAALMGVESERPASLKALQALFNRRAQYAVAHADRSFLGQPGEERSDWLKAIFGLK